MSEHYITLVPEDPRFVPEAANQLRARHRFAEIVQANEIEIIVSEKIKFFDCGENFGRILCPSCHSEIAVAWWKQRMNDDYAKGFILAAYATPCCRSNARYMNSFTNGPKDSDVLPWMQGTRTSASWKKNTNKSL